MMTTVKGKFEIQNEMLPGDDATSAIGAMRMKFTKQFEGALQGTSVVAMMGVLDQKLGSGAYVALEKFTGNLGGKKGSFDLQHSSSMFRGEQSQLILVVPDSGTDELSGLTGKMKIDIVDQQHFYTFEYELR
jgi:hypothetical protein